MTDPQEIQASAQVPVPVDATPPVDLRFPLSQGEAATSPTGPVDAALAGLSDISATNKKDGKSNKEPDGDSGLLPGDTQVSEDEEGLASKEAHDKKVEEEVALDRATAERMYKNKQIEMDGVLERVESILHNQGGQKLTADERSLFTVEVAQTSRAGRSIFVVNTTIPTKFLALLEKEDQEQAHQEADAVHLETHPVEPAQIVTAAQRHLVAVPDLVDAAAPENLTQPQAGVTPELKAA
jgi:hypothetical protein